MGRREIGDSLTEQEGYTLNIYLGEYPSFFTKCKKMQKKNDKTSCRFLPLYYKI